MLFFFPVCLFKYYILQVLLQLKMANLQSKWTGFANLYHDRNTAFSCLVINVSFLDSCLTARPKRTLLVHWPAFSSIVEIDWFEVKMYVSLWSCNTLCVGLCVWHCSIATRGLLDCTHNYSIATHGRLDYTQLQYCNTWPARLHTNKVLRNKAGARLNNLGVLSIAGTVLQYCNGVYSLAGHVLQYCNCV
jgi:hypothetical protein